MAQSIASPTETETTDQRNYREVCERISHLNADIEAADLAVNQHVYENQIPTLPVRAAAAELQEKLERLLRERQNLLPVFADLHSKINGWS